MLSRLTHLRACVLLSALLICAAGIGADGIATAMNVPTTRTCRIEDYRPIALFEFLRQTMSNSSLVLLSDKLVVTNVMQNRRALMRNAAVIGQVELEEDLRTRSSKLTLFDMNNNALYTAREKNYACPEDKPIGRCTAMEIEFESEKIEGGAIPFRIILDHGEKLNYERYGQRTNQPAWARDLKNSLEWLNALLLKTQSFAPLVGSPKERLQLTLASDFYLAPYSDALEYAEKEQKWYVSGTLPNNAYLDRAKKLVRDAEFQSVVFQVDFRNLPLKRIDPGVGRCYGYFVDKNGLPIRN